MTGPPLHGCKRMLSISLGYLSFQQFVYGMTLSLAKISISIHKKLLLQCLARIINKQRITQLFRKHLMMDQDDWAMVSRMF